MVKKKQDNDYKDILTMILCVVMIGSAFLLGNIIGNHEGERVGVQDGMNQAEFNCAKLICEKNDCKTIQIITEVQNYCKGLVYGTDFYMGLGQ